MLSIFKSESLFGHPVASKNWRILGWDGMGWNSILCGIQKAPFCSLCDVSCGTYPIHVLTCRYTTWSSEKKNLFNDVPNFKIRKLNFQVIQWFTHPPVTVACLLKFSLVACLLRFSLVACLLKVSLVACLLKFSLVACLLKFSLVPLFRKWRPEKFYSVVDPFGKIIYDSSSTDDGYSLCQYYLTTNGGTANYFGKSGI